MIPFLDLANHNNRRETSCNIAYKFSTKQALVLFLFSLFTLLNI